MPHKTARPKTGWGITTGLVGYEQQVLGVLEGLVDEPHMIVVEPSGPSKWFAPWFPPNNNPKISPPWPDIVITAGRQSAPYAKSIGKRSGGKTFTAVLQDPKAPPSWFDFLWVNEHDKATGPNVMRTLTAPHRVTAQRLEAHAARLSKEVSSLPGPYIGLLLGGPNSVYEFSSNEAAAMGVAVAELASKRGASVLVTPSRRTGDERMAAITAALSGTPHWIWGGVTENPYFGILGLSDEIVVSCDSSNMLGEAAVTGKPLHIAKLEGNGGKFERFHANLINKGIANWLDEMQEPWAYAPLNSCDDIVSEILRRYDLKMHALNTDQ